MPHEAEILFVCRANLCRSPIAERLTRLALGQGSSGASATITAVSAGTHARSGDPMHPGAVRALQRAGIDCTEFASRALRREMIDRADIVLTATREQRAVCAALAPAAVRRLFTIRQFGRLAAAVGAPPLAGVDPARRLEAVVSEVARARGEMQPVSATEDDLPDPLRASAADIRTCIRQIRTSLRPMLELITSR